VGLYLRGSREIEM